MTNQEQETIKEALRLLANAIENGCWNGVTKDLEEVLSSEVENVQRFKDIMIECLPKAHEEDGETLLETGFNSGWNSYRSKFINNLKDKGFNL